jgi:hypothetical protein
MAINNLEDVNNLDDLLSNCDDGMKKLFVKVMNMHAGFQISDRTDKQLIEDIHKEIEKVVNNQPNTIEEGVEENDL